MKKIFTNLKNSFNKKIFTFLNNNGLVQDFLQRRLNDIIVDDEKGEENKIISDFDFNKILEEDVKILRREQAIFDEKIRDLEENKYFRKFKEARRKITDSFDNSWKTFPRYDTNNIDNITKINYFYRSFIPYRYLENIATDEIVNKCCSTPVKDVVNTGFKVISSNEDILKKIDEVNNSNNTNLYSLNKTLVMYSSNNRIYGVSYCLPLIYKDGDLYREVYASEFSYNSEFLEEDGLEFKGFNVIYPEHLIYDTKSFDFTSIGTSYYSPEYYYEINGGILIHRSWLNKIIYNPVGMYLLPRYRFGGISLTQLIWDEVYSYAKAFTAIDDLIKMKRIFTIDIDRNDYSSINKANIDKLVHTIKHYITNNSVLIKRTASQITQIQADLKDLPPALETYMNRLSAVSGIPVSILFGLDVKGFNNTGNLTILQYKKMLKSIQLDLENIINMHYKLAFKVNCKLEDINFKIVWNPFDDSSELENKKKSIELGRFYVELAEKGIIDAGILMKKLEEEDII